MGRTGLVAFYGLWQTEYQPGIRMDFRQSKIQRCLEMGSGQKRCAVAASLVTAFVGWSQSGQLVLQVDRQPVASVPRSLAPLQSLTQTNNYPLSGHPISSLTDSVKSVTLKWLLP
jgi:hypothetical protein